jgi:nitric oxide-associated protein 1
VFPGGVYLLGGTNAGKSSLFNSLIDSDLCHIHALDCIQRATVSNLPGRLWNRVDREKVLLCVG